MIANLRLEREEDCLDAELDLDIWFSPLEFQQVLDGFGCKHDDDQQTESSEDLRWPEDEFDKELEPKSRTSSSDHDSLSAGSDDRRNMQEYLLAERSQIQAELGLMSIVKTVGKY